MRAPDPGTLSVYGGLHLAGVNAAAAVYDRAMTATLLARAREIAGRTGDGNRTGTAFGHVNVAMHAISASLQLGGAKAAIQTGESLGPAALPAGLTGRRTQLSLDMARAYAMRRQDAAAVNLLLAAERLSPQLVRYDGRTRKVITSLLHREHQPSTQPSPRITGKRSSPSSWSDRTHRQRGGRRTATARTHHFRELTKPTAADLKGSFADIQEGHALRPAPAA